MTERRQHTRYPASLEVWAREISPAGTPDASGPVIRGEVRNVSDGGLCVVWDRAPNSSSILRCRICVDGASAAIPTLAQVRWTRQGDGDSVAGMAFLLQ